MKFSFSTKGWHNSTFEGFCDIAQDLGFEGIELHNIHNRLFTAKDGAFHDYTAAATLRRLYEKKLQIVLCLFSFPAQSGISASGHLLTAGIWKQSFFQKASSALTTMYLPAAKSSRRYVFLQASKR